MSEKPVRWETTVKTYDAQDNLLTETTTTVVQASPPPAGDGPSTGQYL